MNPLTPDPTKAFLGVGWAFPPALEPDGTSRQAVYEEDIKQAIRIILETNPGERIMRPTFGAGLRQFVFEPVNATTMTLVRTRIEEALVDWEPRIIVDGVQVTTDEETRNVLKIDVAYRVRTTNAVQNLVYPFYLQEGPGA
jgi:phage baseplate assembly protein W